MKYLMIFLIGCGSMILHANTVNHADLQLPEQKKHLLTQLAEESVYVEQVGQQFHIWIPQSKLFFPQATELNRDASKLLNRIKALLSQMTVPHLTITGFYDHTSSPEWQGALVRGQMESLSDNLWANQSMGSLLLMDKEAVAKNTKLSFWRNTKENVFFELSFNQGSYDI